MNKLIFTLTLLVLSTLITNAANSPHSIFFMGTRNLQVENSVYLNLKNPDYEAWSSPYNKFTWGAGYSYKLNSILSVGLQVEKETIQFDNYTIGENATAKRFAGGLHFEATYPEKPLHLAGGGFLNYGKSKSNDFDFKLNGFEYGLYLGPEIDIKQFKVSIFMKPKFGYYTSGGENAESLLQLYPALALRLKYIL